MTIFIDMSDIFKRCPICKGIYDIEKPHNHTEGTDLRLDSPETDTQARIGRNNREEIG